MRYEKLKRLDEVIDRINRENGSETIVLGSQQYTAKDGKGKAGVFRDSIKHDFRSPNYTTRWSDNLRRSKSDMRQMRHATNATFAVFKMMIENGGKCDKIIIYNIY